MRDKLMQNKQLRKQHIQSFARLTLSERLTWVLTQHRFLAQFMNPEAKQVSRNIKRHGKKYFGD
jgi:hypothetical protein